MMLRPLSLSLSLFCGWKDPLSVYVTKLHVNLCTSVNLPRVFKEGLASKAEVISSKI